MAMQLTLRKIKHVLILTLLLETPVIEGQVTFSSKHDLVTRPALSRSQGHTEERGTKLVSEIVSRTVSDYLSACHLVLVTSGRSDFPAALLRRGLGTGWVMVQVESAVAGASSSGTALLQGLWGAADASCRAIVVDLMNNYDRSAFRFLAAAGLPEQPKTRVLLVGPKNKAAGSLLQPALKNSVYAVYFSMVEDNANSSSIEVFRRCLYCRGGEAGVVPLGPWHSHEATPTEEELFPGKLLDKLRMQCGCLSGD